MIPVRPAKRFQSAANIKPDRLRKGLLKGQFLFAPDISIPEHDVLPPATTDKYDELLLMVRFNDLFSLVKNH
jgi:hypothetical protein